MRPIGSRALQPGKSLASEKSPGLAAGFLAFLESFSFIRKNSLSRYLILPSLLSLLTGTLLIAGSYYLVDALSAKYLEKAILILGDWISVLAKFAALAFSFLLFIFLYRPIAQICVIPFLGPLLEKTETLLIGRSIEVSLQKDIRNAFIGGLLSLRYLILELLAFLITIPLGPFQFPIMLCVGGYFLGRSSIDYVLEKNCETMEERKAHVKRLRPAILGLGIGQFLIIMIPVAGVFIAPGPSLVGAALIFYDREK